MAEKKLTKPKSKTKPTKKKVSVSEIRSEIKQLHGAIEELHQDLVRMEPPSAMKRAGRSFLG